MLRTAGDLLPGRLRGHSHAAAVFVALTAAGLVLAVIGLLSLLPTSTGGPYPAILWLIAATPCALMARAIAIGRIGTSLALDRAALIGLVLLAATTYEQMLQTSSQAQSLTAKTCLVVVVAGLVLRSRGVLLLAWLGVVAPWAVVLLIAWPANFPLASWLSTWVLAIVLSAGAYLISTTERHVNRGLLGSIRSAAHKDGLTGLANRAGFQEQASTLLRLACQRESGIWCAFLDVDGFKAVNDVLGHDAGDEVLVAVARAIERVGRDSDLQARWGGDEFIVLGLGAGPDPFDLEIRLRDRLSRLRPEILEQWSVSVTVGLAAVTDSASIELAELVAAADAAMYERRRVSGRPRR